MKTRKENEVKREPNGRWQKGECPNPGGRPKKGHSITELIRGMFDEDPELKKLLGEKIMNLALKGDSTAIKLIWNYLDGKPVQRNINTDTTVDELIAAQEE